MRTDKEPQRSLSFKSIVEGLKRVGWNILLSLIPSLPLSILFSMITIDKKPPDAGFFYLPLDHLLSGLTLTLLIILTIFFNLILCFIFMLILLFKKRYLTSLVLLISCLISPPILYILFYLPIPF